MPLGGFFRCRSSADCITIMSGSDLRHGQLPILGGLHDHYVRISISDMDGRRLETVPPSQWHTFPENRVRGNSLSLTQACGRPLSTREFEKDRLLMRRVAAPL